MKKFICTIVSDRKFQATFISYFILIGGIFIPAFTFAKEEFWKNCVKAIRRDPSLSQACVTLKVDMKGVTAPGAIHLLEHLLLTGKDEFKLEQEGLYLQAYTELKDLIIKIHSKKELVPKALEFLSQLTLPNSLKDFNQQKKIILLEDKTFKVWGCHRASHQILNQVENITLDQIKQIYNKYWNSNYFFLTIDYPLHEKKKLPLLNSPHLFALGEGKGSSLYKIFRLGLGSCYSCGTKSNEVFIYSNCIFTESYFKEILLKNILEWDNFCLKRIQKLGPLEIKGTKKMVGEMPNWTLAQLKSSARQWVLEARLEVIHEKEGLFYISLKNRK